MSDPTSSGELFAGFTPTIPGELRHAGVVITYVPFSRAHFPDLDTSIPPWPRETVEIGGTPLHIRRTPYRGGVADNATVLYVHGLGGTAGNWTDLAGQLAPFAEGVAPDLWGFGMSEPPTDFDFTLQSQADALRQYISMLDCGPVHVVGNSMGGAISIVLAAQAPELVRTLTLISPAVPDLRVNPYRLANPRTVLTVLPVIGPRVRQQLGTQTPEDTAAQTIRACFANPDLCSPTRMRELAEEHRFRAQRPWALSALERSTRNIILTWLSRGAKSAKSSLWTVLPTIDIPSLVIWGNRDRIITVRRAMRTAKLLPQGRLLVLPQTGHVAQMERPATVARAIVGMWESVDHDRW